MRLTTSFAHAFRGLFRLLKSQPNARIHAMAGCGVCVAGALLRISRAEWLAVLLAIGLVVVAEGFNSALESLADRVTAERDPLVRDAKDLGAGAVLAASIVAAIVGAIVFLPRIVDLFSDGPARP